MAICSGARPADSVTGWEECGLRVLMVTRGVMPVGSGSGGAELVAFQLARHLKNCGEDVVLVSDVDSSWREQAAATLPVAETGTYRGLGRLVRRVPLDFPRWVLQHLLGNVRAARRAAALLRRDGPGFDVVHVHGALAAILLRRKLGQRPSQPVLVYTEHDSTPWSCPPRGRLEYAVRRWVYRAVNLRACRAASTVVVNFASLADELATRAGIPPARFAIVPNAAEAGWLSPARGIAASPARHGFGRYCLFVGSLVERKGPDILLRALAGTGLPCIFVGDGPLRAPLERLAARSGLADRVVFTGAIEHAQVRSYYSGAELLVLPSVSEGVPLAAIEALGAGVPVVASNLTGIATVVRHGENGLLVEPGDRRSLGRALSLLEADPDLLARLRQGAERSHPALLSWAEVAGQLGALYRGHALAAEALPAVPGPALAGGARPAAGAPAMAGEARFAAGAPAMAGEAPLAAGPPARAGHARAASPQPGQAVTNA
jgi:glycosyltransferase involved in cell wall biosynthesis